jgi:hypothetical protein
MAACRAALREESGGADGAEQGPQAVSAAAQAEGDSEGEAGAGLNFDPAHGVP